MEIAAWEAGEEGMFDPLHRPKKRNLKCAVDGLIKILLGVVYQMIRGPRERSSSS